MASFLTSASIPRWILVILTGSVVGGMAAPADLAASECELVARWDQSTLQHALAGAGVYVVSRGVGAGRREAMGWALGVNLAKEVYDVCGSGFDAGDLLGGGLGAVAMLLLDRGLEWTFMRREVRVSVLPGRQGKSLALGASIGFP